MYNNIIIGGGPAALTAAIYAANAQLEPLVFEGFMAGGVPAGGQLMITTYIDNFPGFAEPVLAAQLMMDMRQQALNRGAKIETKTVDTIEKVSDGSVVVSVGSEQYETKSLIIATGATAKRLGISGEDQYRQKGMSACAVCDGGLPMFRDKVLVVIGGGDSACEEASYLTKFASKVLLFVRKDHLRASKTMQQRVIDNGKIDIMRHTEAREVIGNGKQLQQVRIFNNQTKEESVLDIGGLFYAIGHKPNTDFLGGLVETDEVGYIVLKGPTTQTSVSGIFAAGDVADKIYRQAIVAAGSGCKAALEVEHYLHG